MIISRPFFPLLSLLSQQGGAGQHRLSAPLCGELLAGTHGSGALGLGLLGEGSIRNGMTLPITSTMCLVSCY